MAGLFTGRLARGVAFSVAIGLFLSFVGAFGTEQAPWAQRTAVFLALALFAGVCGNTLARWAAAQPWAEGRLRLQFAVTASAMTLLMTAAIWLVLSYWSGGRIGLGALPAVFLNSVIASGAITALSYAVLAPRPTVTHAAPAGAAPAKFLARLPPKLRGATLWALQAEDHYLRLHTSRGEDLILMRLADAIGELEGVEGAQTHRSWWVAREAVKDAKRGDGKATLTLPNGREAPVSRTFAKALRDEGWF